jgi:hypothetical protein
LWCAVQPKVVIATTTWWPQAARLAVALANAGAHVGAVCPDGSSLAMVSGVRELFKYSALPTARSLAAALRTMRPDLVVPCDERTVAHLHELHLHELHRSECNRSAPADDFLRRLIERSLGAPQGYAATLDRGASLALAAQAGIRVPATRVLRSETELRAWCADRPLPTLLKADGTWGGAGVKLVDSPASAVAAFRRMTRPMASWRVAKFLLSNRDPFPLAGWLRRERPSIIGQDFVPGCPANVMAACWQGEVLEVVGVQVLDMAKQFGTATVIRPMIHAGMEAATRRLVRRLGMSGFCGLDFLIEAGTDEAHLIELNPRATQLGHLQLGPGRNLAVALLGRLRDEMVPRASPPQIAPAAATQNTGTQQTITQETIALFPQAWLSAGAAPLLRSAYHDVPWDEPALVAELLRRPWEIRSPLARLTDLLLRRPDPARLLAASFGRVNPTGPAQLVRATNLPG